jgi:alpha-1,3-rhamnosyl/mannosyltransferase
MTRVTLCVDALEPNPGGIGRYTWELCKGVANDERLSPLSYFGRGRMLDDPALLLRGDPLPRRPRLWRQWRDRRAMRSSVVHGPNYFLPPFVERGIITVHDLSVFRFPETHPVERVNAFEREFTSSLARASHVITDTETVRREVIEMFALAPETVTAVPLGVDAAFSPQSAAALAPTLSQWGLQPGAYGLCVSTLEPRKRIAELLAAWRALPRRLRDAFPLVLCGGAGWRNEQLRALVEAGVGGGWLRHLGFVDETLLPHLYAGAGLFIYPSIYEGFGLPPLEALASGVPVMVADRSCLPEVCGDAARYFDADDVDGLAMAIETNLGDVQWRATARERGVARASRFSWAQCVERTVDLYARLG